jgi:hypothetical protein
MIFVPAALISKSPGPKYLRHCRDYPHAVALSAMRKRREREQLMLRFIVSSAFKSEKTAIFRRRA